MDLDSQLTRERDRGEGKEREGETERGRERKGERDGGRGRKGEREREGERERLLAVPVPLTSQRAIL